VRFFVKNGVKSLFEQGNYSGGGNGEMGPLRAYLLAKLLWNPDTDVQKHTQEFVTAYYGKAAPKILAYLDCTHAPAREKSLHAHIFDPPSSPYLKKEVMDTGEKLLEEADQLADDDTIRFRVQMVAVPVWYTKIANGRVKGEAKKELTQRLVAVARKAGVSNINEGTTLADWAKQQGVE
jgi:hypothetical protein